MCAQFTLKTTGQKLASRWEIEDSPFYDQVWDFRVRGFMKTEKAPVILMEKNKKGDRRLQIKEMYFSLCPSWSPEFPSKWTSYNARMDRPAKKPGTIEKIYQVPTWREPFTQGQTCIVPMNSAIESSYFGTQAGNMVQFSIQSGEVFYVLGLWSQWINKTTGEINDSFTLITDDPYEFFYKSGHDRSVVVINESAMNEWLSNDQMPPEERFQLVRKNRISLDWTVNVDRPMAKGWEKRKPTLAEINDVKIWTPLNVAK